MLDLANDCSHFVNGCFEIISASSPHIYHSALVLAPTTSIVRELYKSHAHPFVRAVYGAPVSWGLNTAATTLPSTIKLVVWSPCSRFIAATWSHTMTVFILDPVTLERLQTLEAPPDTPTDHGALGFSPDSRMLTRSSSFDNPSNWELSVVVWDLQTGGVVSAIREQGSNNKPLATETTSITYSVDGKMVGVFYRDHETATIFICDLTSGVHTHTHSFGIPSNNDVTISNNMWIRGESLRFATTTLVTITIWEVGFASGTTPTQVGTVSIPGDTLAAPPPGVDVTYYMTQIQLLPALSRLAIVRRGRFLVWDGRNSDSLLHCVDIQCRPSASSSSDGRFIACPTTGSEIYLWKESPTGYTPHGILTSSGWSDPLLSPNGESILVSGDHLIQLWRTNSLATPPSDISTRGPQHTRNFVLDFSPDGQLAVFARLGGNRVTVIDLGSGVLQLAINTGMEVCGLRATRNLVVVIGDKRTITWNLPAEDFTPDTTVDVEDSTLTVNLDGRGPRGGSVIAASISNDLRHIALLLDNSFLLPLEIEIYSGSTGEWLGRGLIPPEQPVTGDALWFAPDGRNVWCAVGSGEAGVWTINDEDPNSTEMVCCDGSAVGPQHPPEGYPWGSSRGYRVTDDGWVLGPDGKRLLMLPPPWRSYAVRRTWNGRFLALLHGGLPELVVLELES